MRVIGGGRDMHPFHHHGNHARIIAVDGFLKQSSAPPTPDTLDLSHEVFTIQSLPGQTVDAIFRWTGKDLGWDIYGDNPIEYAPARSRPHSLRHRTRCVHAGPKDSTPRPASTAPTT